MYDHNNGRIGQKLHDAGWLTTESSYYRFYIGATKALQLQSDTAYFGSNKFGIFTSSTIATLDGLGGYLDLRSANDIIRIRDNSDTAQEFQIYHSGDETNYERLSIKATGYNYEISPQVNNGTAGSVVITNDTSSKEILVVKGAASQSANLQEWQDSAGLTKASVDQSGSFEGYKGNFSGLVDVKFADSYYTTRIGAGSVKLGSNANLSSNVAYLSWDPGSKIASLSHLGGNGLARLGGSLSTNAAKI